MFLDSGQSKVDTSNNEASAKKDIISTILCSQTGDPSRFGRRLRVGVDEYGELFALGGEGYGRFVGHGKYSLELSSQHGY